MFVDSEEELKINQHKNQKKTNLKLWGIIWFILAEQLKRFHMMMFM